MDPFAALIAVRRQDMKWDGDGNNAALAGFKQWHRRRHHCWHLAMVCLELLVMMWVGYSANRRYRNYMKTCDNLGACIQVQSSVMSDQDFLDLGAELARRPLDCSSIRSYAASMGDLNASCSGQARSCTLTTSTGCCSGDGNTSSNTLCNPCSSSSSRGRGESHGRSRGVGATIAEIWSLTHPVTNFKNGNLSLLLHQMQLLLMIIIMVACPR